MSFQKIAEYTIKTPKDEMAKDPIVLALLESRKSVVFTSYAMRDAIGSDLVSAGIDAHVLSGDLGRVIREFNRVQSGALVCSLNNITGWNLEDIDQVLFYLLDIEPEDPQIRQAIQRAPAKRLNVIYVNCRVRDKREPANIPAKDEKHGRHSDWTGDDFRLPGIS